MSKYIMIYEEGHLYTEDEIRAEYDSQRASGDVEEGTSYDDFKINLIWKNAACIKIDHITELHSGWFYVHCHNIDSHQKTWESFELVTNQEALIYVSEYDADERGEYEWVSEEGERYTVDELQDLTERETRASYSSGHGIDFDVSAMIEWYKLIPVAL